MLLINAHTNRSSIHGLGLIAHEYIPAGTIIWQFTPGFDILIPDRVFRSLSAAARNQVNHYAFHHRDSGQYILSSDDDRFTNHSVTPNTQPTGDYTYAVQDIRKGEEITLDYDALKNFSLRSAAPA